MTTLTRTFLGLCSLSFVLASCARETATIEFCGQVLDRIVEIELHEQGFRDPALAAMKRQELRRRFSPDLQRCVGRPMAPRALSCVHEAATTEELSHRCLR